MSPELSRLRLIGKIDARLERVTVSQGPIPTWEPTIGLLGADFIGEVRRRAEAWWEALNSAQRLDAGMRVIRVIEARYGLRGLKRMQAEVPYHAYLAALEKHVAFHFSMQWARVRWAKLSSEMG